MAIRQERKKDPVAKTLKLRKMCAQKLGYELLFLRWRTGGILIIHLPCRSRPERIKYIH